MQTFILKDNELFNQVFDNNIKIGVIGIKPGEDFKPGNLSIFLSGMTDDGIFRQTIYNLRNSIELQNEWNYLDPIQWFDIQIDDGKLLKDCVLVLADKTDRFIFSSETHWDWTYYIAIKNKTDDSKVVFDHVNISSNYCMNFSYTDGDNSLGISKTLGATCPIDPLTNKQMKSCLNWRRTDIVGEKCNSLLTEEEKNKSKKVFCSKFTNAQDCKCINRSLDPAYQASYKHRDTHDYCWYLPCKSGAYLRDHDDKNIACSSGNRVIYDVGHVGGGVSISSNTGWKVGGNVLLSFSFILVLLLLLR